MDNREEVWTFKDYYATLEIKPTATGEEIKRAFWRKSPALRKKAEWDKQTGQEFIALLEAYRILSEPTAKRVYDKLYSLSPEGKKEVLRIARGKDYVGGVITAENVREDRRALGKTLASLGEMRLYAGEKETIDETLRAAEQDRKEEIPADIKVLIGRMVDHTRYTLEAHAQTLQERIKNPIRKDSKTLLEESLNYYTTLDNENKRLRHSLIGARITGVGICTLLGTLGYVAFSDSKSLSILEAGAYTGIALGIGGYASVILSTLYYKQKNRRETGQNL